MHFLCYFHTCFSYGADTELSTENVFKTANNVSSNRLLQELKLCVDPSIATNVLIKEKRSWVVCATGDDSKNGNVPGLPH